MTFATRPCTTSYLRSGEQKCLPRSDEKNTTVRRSQAPIAFSYVENEDI